MKDVPKNLEKQFLNNSKTNNKKAEKISKKTLQNSEFKNLCPENYAFAKLVGEKFSYLMQTTEVYLGRRVSKISFVALGDFKTISKTHAKIF